MLGPSRWRQRQCLRRRCFACRGRELRRQSRRVDRAPCARLLLVALLAPPLPPLVEDVVVAAVAWCALPSLLAPVAPSTTTIRAAVAEVAEAASAVADADPLLLLFRKVLALSRNRLLLLATAAAEDAAEEREDAAEPLLLARLLQVPPWRNAEVFLLLLLSPLLRDVVLKSSRQSVRATEDAEDGREEREDAAELLLRAKLLQMLRWPVAWLLPPRLHCQLSRPIVATDKCRRSKRATEDAVERREEEEDATEPSALVKRLPDTLWRDAWLLSPSLAPSWLPPALPIAAIVRFVC